MKLEGRRPVGSWSKVVELKDIRKSNITEDMAEDRKQSVDILLFMQREN